MNQMDPLDLILLLIGVAGGLLTLVMSRTLLFQRQKSLQLPWWLMISGTNLVYWGGLGLTTAVLAAWQDNSLEQVLIRLAWFFTLLALSAVDLAIRKIPNETLVVLLLARMMDLIFQFSWQEVAQALEGLVLGYLLFALTALFGRSIGKGDVKLAAVVGFCLGPIGMFQSVVVLGLTNVIYSTFP